MKFATPRILLLSIRIIALVAFCAAPTFAQLGGLGGLGDKL